MTNLIVAEQDDPSTCCGDRFNACVVPTK